MPRTYEPIASQTLGSAAASVTFSDLPSTFTDVVVVMFTRNNNGTNAGDMAMRFNSDTGSNYSETYLYANGSTASSGRLSGSTYMPWGRSIASNATANVFAVNIAHVMSYANTNVHKTVLNSGANPLTDLVRRVGLWRSTAAITSINVYDANGANLAAGVTVSVFGIKAA